VKESPSAELGELCRHAAGLVRELRESRWAGLTHLRGEAAATPPPRVEPAGREKAPPSRAAGSLDEIRLRVESCTKCPLHETRKKTVFGEGAPSADLLFVGEGPGAEEDRQGRPFVGAAGQLLTDIIVKGMGLRREEVFIANVVKCRPPGNRNPEPAEIAACRGYLHAQIDLISPRVIVALGKFAAQTLLDTPDAISRLRGRFFEYRGIPLMPTFHPSYLLRNPDGKEAVWQDIQQVMERLGLPLKGKEA
jgi:uracil-DNA glycosylase family 4